MRLLVNAEAQPPIQHWGDAGQKFGGMLVARINKFRKIFDAARSEVKSFRFWTLLGLDLLEKDNLSTWVSWFEKHTYLPWKWMTVFYPKFFLNFSHTQLLNTCWPRLSCAWSNLNVDQMVGLCCNKQLVALVGVNREVWEKLCVLGRRQPLLHDCHVQLLHSGLPNQGHWNGGPRSPRESTLS